MQTQKFVAAAVLAVAFAVPAWAQPEAAPPAQPTVHAEATAPEYSDEQLTNFLAASEEIRVIQQRPNASTDPAAIQAMRDSLQRYELDGATYNEIAQRLRSDETFAARIVALRDGAQQQDAAGQE